MTTEVTPVETEPKGYNFISSIDHDVYRDVQAKVFDGKLPKDTFLRLGVIGQLQPDEDGGLLMRRILREINDAPDNPEGLSADTRSLIFGPLPNALLDWNGADFEEYLRCQPQMYYRKGHLVEVIKERREIEGKAVDEPLYDRRLRKEISICRGLAHTVWRAVALEARPEWLDKRRMEYYYQPAISTHPTFELEPDLMRRRIISVAVFRDDLLLRLYERAKSTGISGIGRVAIRDLRVMLAEEHPDLR